MPQSREIQFVLLQKPRQSLRPAKTAGNGSSQPLMPQRQRITRLMALAIKLDKLLADDPSISRHDLARCGRVSRARLTQILNLLNLAPNIQERLLFLEPLRRGREWITEKRIRQICGIHSWAEQRAAFDMIVQAANSGRGGVCGSSETR